MIRPLYIPHRDGEIVNGELVENQHFTIFASENVYTNNAVNVPLDVNASVEKLTNLLEGHIKPELPAELTQINLNSIEENAKAQTILQGMLAQGIDLSPLNYDVPLPIITDNIKQSSLERNILVGPALPDTNISQNTSTSLDSNVPSHIQNSDTRMSEEQILEMHNKGKASGKISIEGVNGPIGTSENYLQGLFRSPDVSKIGHVTIQDFFKPDTDISIDNETQDLKTPNN